MKGTHILLKVGKNGLTDGVIDEIKRHLKKGKVEIKIEKGALLQEDGSLADRKAFAKEMADKADATLVRQMGYHAILQKKRPEKEASGEKETSDRAQTLQPHPVKKHSHT